MKKAWVVAADMGYGHLRAAFALRDIAFQHGVTNANDYPGIPRGDKAIWEQTRRIYEFISRFKKIPVLGDLVFSLMDKAQDIQEFYPKRRPLERPGFQLRTIWQLMEKKAWGKHLMRKLNRRPFPMICTFPVPAFMAEHWGYEGDIFVVVTDSDANRAWLPLSPKETKIQYFAPTKRVAERLAQYGAKEGSVFLTGFPLPSEFGGREGAMRTKEDLRERLSRLDPKKRYLARYADVARRYLGRVPEPSGRPVRITFALGGAGAQQGLGRDIIKNLAGLVRARKIELCMVAATHEEASRAFESAAKEQGLFKGFSVMFEKDKEAYFKRFSQVLSRTDILWTKPSELSFYAALGIPILIAPPIGSQEGENQRWLLQTGAGISQEDVRYASEWIVDYLNQGLFAEAAMEGYVEMERRGAENIAEIIQGKKK